jgi:hypothetical protein
VTNVARRRAGGQFLIWVDADVPGSFGGGVTVDYYQLNDFGMLPDHNLMDSAMVER